MDFKKEFPNIKNKILYIFSIGFFLINTQAFSTSRVKLKKTQRLSSIEKKSSRQKKPHLIVDNCNLLGQKQVLSFNKTSHFFNMTVLMEEWIKKSLPYLNRSASRHCPRFCKQINQYKILSKIYPISTKKKHCKASEKQESYSFKKTFLIENQALKTTHENMQNWILGTFVYPFLPGLSIKISQEAYDLKIHKACPSCSFYFDYNYVYNKNQNLDLNIKVRCGEKRKKMSKTKIQFTLVNSWRCKK